VNASFIHPAAFGRQQSLPMSQNQEIIESKLCAYIDGELDDADRADIEKHLLANPQHRRLLEELRRTTALLRGLPRETAPAELSESFTAQLERSVLLQGISDESSDRSMRIGGNPQFFAVAAIILLTVGLAVVIYFALPSRNLHPVVASSGIHPITKPSDSSLSSVAEVPAEQATRLGDKSPVAALEPRAPVAGPTVADTALVMLVQSDNLDRTHQKLEDYFTANAIQWGLANETNAAHLETSTAPDDRALAFQEKVSAAIDARNRESSEGVNGLGGAIAPAASTNAAGATTGPATRPETSANVAVAERRLQSTTAPAARVADADAVISHGTEEEQRLATATSQAAVRRLVLSARMTRLQATALGDALKREGAAQEARLVETANLDQDTIAEVTAVHHRFDRELDKGLTAPSTRPAVFAKAGEIYTQPSVGAKDDLSPQARNEFTIGSAVAAATRPAVVLRRESGREDNKSGDGRDALSGAGLSDTVKDLGKPAAAATLPAALALPLPSQLGRAPATAKLADPSTTEPAEVEKNRELGGQIAPNPEEPVNLVILIRSDNYEPVSGSATPISAAGPANQPAAPTTQPETAAPTPAATQPAAQ